DHAVQSGTYNVNQPKYLYGGDFGDTINDGNFCMDGMVRPERKPYQSLLEFANVMRPIRFEISNGNVYATNMLDFLDASEIYDVYFEVTENGSSVNNESKQLPHGKIDKLPKLKPHVKTALPIHISNNSNGHLFVKFEIVSKITNDYILQGDVVGFQQIEINDFVQQQLFKNFGNVDFSENELYIKIKGNNFSYVFDKLRGSFCKITYNKCDLIKKPLEFVLWRAPTDNDMYIKKIWESAGYNRIVFRPYDCTIERYQGAVKISCLVSVASVALQRILLINSTYMINGKGQISVNLSIDKNKVMPTLPKFGIRFFLEESFSQVQYLGYGPGESYIDKHYATYFGEFKSNIDGLYENYYNPQENGSHFGCEKLTISSPKRSIIIQAVKSPFSFNASYYTYEELTEAKHDFELKKSGYTVLSVDYKQNGVGSNSCGPELLEKYKFNDSHFDFSFIINPA
ncbi:MAG: beta-galactosidase, partial [bacterium]|nr:beta-galactosidase [bacterium]